MTGVAVHRSRRTWPFAPVGRSGWWHDSASENRRARRLRRCGRQRARRGACRPRRGRGGRGVPDRLRPGRRRSRRAAGLRAGARFAVEPGPAARRQPGPGGAARLPAELAPGVGARRRRPAAALDPDALARIVAAAAPAGPVVLDLARWPSPVRAAALDSCDLAVLVTPAEVRAVDRQRRHRRWAGPGPGRAGGQGLGAHPAGRPDRGAAGPAGAGRAGLRPGRPASGRAGSTPGQARAPARSPRRCCGRPAARAALHELGQAA